MGKKKKDRLRGVKIIFEDKDLLMVDKPSGLLTMGTAKDKINTVYFLLTDYVRKGTAKSRKRVFIVHRLDRETSGLLVFAKNKETQEKLKANWKANEKRYSAVVYGEPEEQSGCIKNRLLENSALYVYVARNNNDGTPTHTEYKVVSSKKGYSLLDVHLVTGFKHQIRVHLANLGHPVVGDKRYAPQKPSPCRLALHAREFSFDHPWTGKRMKFSSEIPAVLRRLI